MPDAKPMRDLEHDAARLLSKGVVLTVSSQGRFGAGAAAKVKIDSKGLKRFHLDVAKAGKYVLFMQGLPSDFGITLNAGGKRQSPLFALDYMAGHVHDQEVTSVSLQEKGSVDEEKFESWIEDLLHTRGEDIYRTKGILNVEGHEARYVFHGVHELLEAGADRAWREGEDRRNQLVFIGRKLDEKALRRGFRQCLLKGKRA